MAAEIVPAEIDSEGSAGAGTEQPEKPVESAGPEGTGEPSPTPPTPNYITKEAFDEAMAGYASHIQQSMEQLAQRFQSGMSRSMPAARPPKPPEEFIPGYSEFEQLTAPQVRELFVKLHKRYEDLDRKYLQRFDSMDKERRMQEDQVKWYNHFNNQIEAASEQYPIFKNPDAREQLSHLISSSINVVVANGGDMRSINVPQIAKKITDFWGKIGGLMSPSAAGPTSPQQKPGGGLLKGAPSVPGKPASPVPKTFQEFDAIADKVLPALFEQRMADEGLTEE